MDRVGAVPPAKSYIEPNASVLLPVPSCETKIDPLCPAVKLLGLASVRLPPKVTLKLLATAKSGVIVAPSVSAVMLPRCAAVKV